MGRVRIRVPTSIQPGEVVRVRTLIMHPMEIIERDEEGKIIPKNYNFIHTMIVSFNGKEILRAETSQSLSENPSFTFPLKAGRPGKLTVAFLDTTGQKYEHTEEIKF